MKLGLLPVTLLASTVVVACATRPDGGGPAAPSPASTTTALAATAPPTGPQSFTPETTPRQRSRAITQKWSAKVGGTDHRTTMAYFDKTVLVGTHDGVVHALDGITGAAHASYPGAKGAIVGIALDDKRIYSTSEGGEVAATTRDGRVLFRTPIGAAATTPPTLVDVKGTRAIAVGDAKGKVSLFDAQTGAKKWSVFVGPEKDARPIGAGLAAFDTDADGIPEIFAGSESGWLVALHADRGDVSWSTTKGSPLRAAPLVADLDADGHQEVIAAWADGDVVVFEGHGKEKWAMHVEKDDGDPTGILASPTPVPGERVGSLIVPTARWGKEDAVLVLRKDYRAYQSQVGRVVASPVLGVLEPGGGVEAVMGTARGDLVSFDARGGISWMYKLDGGVEAPALIADLDADGQKELYVATKSGHLYALGLHATQPPVLGRARGDSMKNDGVLPAIDLGWHLSNEF